MLRRLIFPFVATALFALAFAGPGCANGGEGDRCDHLDDNNGNDDCATGYQCDLASSLNGPPLTDICCPGDRAIATTAVCALTPAPPHSDGGVPNDGGAAGDDGGDAASDAPVDSAKDSAMDAPNDAPIDSSLDAPNDSPIDSSSDAPIDSGPDTGDVE